MLHSLGPLHFPSPHLCFGSSNISEHRPLSEASGTDGSWRSPFFLPRLYLTHYLLLWLLYLGLEPFQGQGSTHFSLHVSGFGTVSGTGLAPCRLLVGCIDLFRCLLDSAVLYAVCKSLTAVVLGKGAAENSNLTCPSQSARPLGQVYLTPCIGNLLG